MTGLDIARAARIRSGATYIALTRLVRYGAVTSRWVQVDPWSGALQRRMYELAKEES
jgi:DNA-binding PadR family transcriptional regulator